MVESARFCSYLALTTITPIIYWASELSDSTGTLHEFISVLLFTVEIMLSIKETEAISECRSIKVIGGWFKSQTDISDSREPDVCHH